jgi:hypothetical protein
VTGVREAVEDLFVEAFVAQAAVEAFNQPVLLGLARIDVMPGHFGITCPFEDRRAGELGTIIADNAVGFTVNPDHRGQFPRHTRTKDAGIDDQPQILAGAVIIYRQNTELAGCTEGVGHKIQ